MILASKELKTQKKLMKRAKRNKNFCKSIEVCIYSLYFIQKAPRSIKAFIHLPRLGVFDILTAYRAVGVFQIFPQGIAKKGKQIQTLRGRIDNTLVIG